MLWRRVLTTETVRNISLARKVIRLEVYYRSIFNHCDIIGLQSYIEFGGKKRKIRTITLFFFTEFTEATKRCAGMTFLFPFPSHSHRIISILISDISTPPIPLHL